MKQTLNTFIHFTTITTLYEVHILIIVTYTHNVCILRNKLPNI